MHPAFTNETSIDFANGGWDKELTGIWVAKFEAGYASGNNNAPVKASNINYSTYSVTPSTIESGLSTGTRVEARNWLDGIYGTKTTAIKYPVFQPSTYVMNYITKGDAFDIAKVLNESGNIYGFNDSNVDSHLMKDSEWGAVVYLGYSQYGTNGVEPYKNNINLNSGNRKRTETAGKSGVDSVYAVTGMTTGEPDAEEKIVTLEEINGTTKDDGIYTWNQMEGQKSSITLNMYGVYDLNGGTSEITATYLAYSQSDPLKIYGNDMTYNGDVLKTESTKYTLVYPYDETQDFQGASITDEQRRQYNYLKNKYIFGNAIRETSSRTNIGDDSFSWNKDFSWYLYTTNTFSVRGGVFTGGEKSGLFSFSTAWGDGHYYHGFRPILISKK